LIIKHFEILINIIIIKMDSSYVDDKVNNNSDNNTNLTSEVEEFSAQIAEKLDVSIFAANIIQYVSERSWCTNKIIHLVVRADAISGFDFCSFMRGDYELEFKKHNVRIINGEYIPDYYTMLFNL